MRRTALVISSGAIWLFLAAIPVLADNGPHMKSVNNGMGGINADSCAGCHRAHTAQGEMLLIDEQPAICLVCHGSSGAGATTDVYDGIQFAAGTTHDASTGTGVIGPLRGGGFAYARIGSSNPTRYSYLPPVNASGSGFTGLVPAASTGQAVKSGHMPVVGGVVSATTGTAWGNYDFYQFSADPYAGPTVSMTCTTCHNPHGNGKYRILNPIPAPVASSGSTFVPIPFSASVTDAAAVPAGQTRNYTNPPAQYVSGIGSAVQDYWRYCVPWNNCGNNDINRGDRPNGLPSGAFATQITTWCVSCHTRYLAGSGSAKPGSESGDAIFQYRHTTSQRPECTQCHVSHGSNARMAGTYSAAFPYPDGTRSGSSRLLKIDNRGTCQMCHDPTGTVTTQGVTTVTP